MLLIDPDDGKIVNANNEAILYYGYPKETITKMYIHEINTLSKNQIEEKYQKVLKYKQNYFTFIHRTSSGEERYVRVHSAPIRFENRDLLLSIIFDNKDEYTQLNLLQNDLDSTLAAIPDLLFELGLDGRYYKIRSHRTDLMAAPSKEMLGKTVTDILPKDAANTCLLALEEANKYGISEGKQILLNLDGNEKWFELSVAKKSNTFEEEPHFIVLSRDITSRKNKEQELLESEERFKAIHDASSGGIVIHEKGKVLECNANITKLFGYRYEEAIGMDGLLFISEKSLDTVKNHIQNAYEKPYDVIGRHKNGKKFPIRIESREIIYKGKKTRVTEFNDITIEKQIQDKLKQMAHYDSLTNLPNRILFADRLKQSIAHTKRNDKFLAVVYIDIDGFKTINDNHGHDIGDKLLIAIAQKMKNVLREEDTIARFGGDEFVAVISNLEKENDCTTTLKRLLKAASSSTKIENKKLQVTASIGVTIYPNDNEDTDILIRHADQAMYKAKQDGKNRYSIFNVKEEIVIKQGIKTINDISKALKNNEFVLYYQPKVNIKTRKIIGVEALIRWKHPQKGLLTPIEFLPFIENHDLSHDVGRWVINQALNQIETWKKNGIEIPISVNVGAKQLQNDFVYELKTLLSAHKYINPKLLSIEILETSFLEDISLVRDVIRTCTNLGIKFYIDDFGTGYSSLNYLKVLPVSTLKIDKSFVFDMKNSKEDLSIVKGVIALSKAFNKDVIAEGVESIEQAKLLLSLGCELVQGYAISRPIQANEFPSWIKQWENNEDWKKLR